VENSDPVSERYPEEVRRLNRILVSELGSNPRYAWRWSEDLKHVMYVVDDLGRPEYVEAPVNLSNGKVIYQRLRKTAVRNLLPFHKDQWVCCALVEVDEKDGRIEGTGNANWIPLSSSASGPAALPYGVNPTAELTQCVIRSVRQQRDTPPAVEEQNWEESRRKSEKDRWNRAYDCIRDASAAFYNYPGHRGHVSFPDVEIKPKGVVYDDRKSH
jgi:hypothetical protein